MPATTTAPALLADFTQRGFTLRDLSGRLSVSPATALTAADRDVIRQRRNELLSLLSPGEPWDQKAAARLMHDADAVVERLGIDRGHPVIADAAAMVCSAHETRDMENLRFAIAEFAVTARRLAAEATQG